MSASPLVHVVISSSHNVAEFRCLLEFRPEVLVVVSAGRQEEHTRRLLAVAQSALPDLRIEVLPEAGEAPLEGDQGESIRAFLQASLKPRLDDYRRRGYRCILNATGGTKLQPLFLTHGVAWDEIHYLPIGSGLLQRFTPSLESLPDWPLQAQVSILQHAQLYLDQVNSRRPTDIECRPEALEVARYLFDQYATAARDQSARSDQTPWGVLAALIEKGNCWFGKDPIGSEWVRLESASLDPTLPAVQTLVQCLGSLGEFIRVREGQVEIVTREHRESENWRRWLAGIWFENLIEAWIRTLYPTSEVAHSVQLHQFAGDDGRESDLLVRYNNHLYVIETKVDLQINQPLATSVDHLGETGGRLGKTKVALLFSPAYAWRHRRKEEYKSILDITCRAAGIMGLIVERPEDLRRVFEPENFSSRNTRTA